MRSLDVSDHSALGDVQRGEQVTGPVAFIVVGRSCRGGGQHRECRGGPVDRLDLRFLVDGEHHCCDRWVHVEADDVTDLLDQLRVGRHFEGVLDPRFQAERPPDLRDTLMADPVLLGEVAGGPVRSVLGCRFEGLDDDRFDGVVADLAWRPRSWGINEPVETVLSETVTPLRHRCRVAALIGRDCGVQDS